MKKIIALFSFSLPLSFSLTACQTPPDLTLLQSRLRSTTPTPTPTQWSAPNNYPPSTWTPYSSTSPFNTPISPLPQPDPNSQKYLAFYTKNFPWFASLTFGYLSQTNQYQHPIYFSTSSDPTYSVSCLADWAVSLCPTSTTFHIPSYAQPAGGPDGHFTVIDYSTATPQELDCWATYTIFTPTLTAQACGSGPLSSDGLGFGQTAAGYAQWAGVIRASELIPPGQINHALFVVAPCTSNSSVYPSINRTADTFCSAGAPYGARLRLNLTSAQINALKVPTYHKTILLALSRYGGYIGDTNGQTNFGLQVEADTMYTAPHYTNPECPALPIPCTPLTAYMNQYDRSTWTGSNYNIDISKDVPATSYQFLLPPTR